MDILPKNTRRVPQTHEKIINITNHQGNANTTHNELLPHTRQNEYHQVVSTGGNGMEERELLSFVGGVVNWCSHKIKVSCFQQFHIWVLQSKKTETLT